MAAGPLSEQLLTAVAENERLNRQLHGLHNSAAALRQAIADARSLQMHLQQEAADAREPPLPPPIAAHRPLLASDAGIMEAASLANSDAIEADIATMDPVRQILIEHPAACSLEKHYPDSGRWAFTRATAAGVCRILVFQIDEDRRCIWAGFARNSVHRQRCYRSKST